MYKRYISNIFNNVVYKEGNCIFLNTIIARIEKEDNISFNSYFKDLDLSSFPKPLSKEKYKDMIIVLLINIIEDHETAIYLKKSLKVILQDINNDLQSKKYEEDNQRFALMENENERLKGCLNAIIGLNC